MDEEAKKPYAIVAMDSLRVLCFNTKDEMLNAIADCRRRDAECMALRWYPMVGRYGLMEQHATSPFAFV